MNRRKFLSRTLTGAAIGLAVSSPLVHAAESFSRKQEIKAIAFDGFPIFDPRPIVMLVKTLFPKDGEQFRKMWFNKIFSYSWLRTNGDRYKGFYEIIEDALIYTTKRLNVEFNEVKREQLMEIWLNLKPWPDVVSALNIYKDKGIRLGFLSNLSEEMLRINARSSGIEESFEFYLTTDKVRAFKPSPTAYQMGVDAFKLPKKNIAFAAFGAWDAVGASWFGYPTVWVNRFGLPEENLDANGITVGRGIDTLTEFVVHS